MTSEVGPRLPPGQTLGVGAPTRTGKAAPAGQVEVAVPSRAPAQPAPADALGAAVKVSPDALSTALRDGIRELAESVTRLERPDTTLPEGQLQLARATHDVLTAVANLGSFPESAALAGLGKRLTRLTQTPALLGPGESFEPLAKRVPDADALAERPEAEAMQALGAAVGRLQDDASPGGALHGYLRHALALMDRLPVLQERQELWQGFCDVAAVIEGKAPAKQREALGEYLRSQPTWRGQSNVPWEEVPRALAGAVAALVTSSRENPLRGELVQQLEATATEHAGGAGARSDTTRALLHAAGRLLTSDPGDAAAARAG